MKHLIAILLAGLVALLFACGGDDDEEVAGPTAEPPSGLVEELSDVCTETDEVAGDDILRIVSPEPGEEVSSPIVVSGSAQAFQGTVWVAVVKADGEHVIDYPGKTTGDGEERTLAPYEISVPFTVIEDTPVCLWVYRRNVPEPVDARRIPIVLVPSAEPSR